MATRSKKTKVDGIEFHSAMESRYYLHLKYLVTQGIVETFELQPIFILQERFRKNGKTFRPITYSADFFVVYTDGHIEIVDVKGRKEEVFKIKHKLFEFKYPQYSLRLLTDDLQEGHFIDYDKYLRLKPKPKKKEKKNIGTRAKATNKKTTRKGSKIRKNLPRKNVKQTKTFLD